ncbi:hypothetical protein BKA57DRAFT_104584 [Linnemannia elongata]|nr:hypothetical protein BKA57DRAFT_104584 [Linnemannia elongata]
MNITSSAVAHLAKTLPHSKYRLNIYMDNYCISPTLVSSSIFAPSKLALVVEFFILRCLLPVRNQVDRSQGSHEDDTIFGDDALDLLLGKDSGGVTIRNLISFALRGSASTQAGRKAEKPDSVHSYTLAISIFEQFQALHPSIKALNPNHIPLSKVQQDLVPKICLAIKMHYRKLPTIIVDKMKKIGFDPSTIPSYDGEEEEEKEEDNGDEFRDEEEETIKKSDKIVFEAGHIKT